MQVKRALVLAALALLFAGCGSHLPEAVDAFTTPGPEYGPCGIGVSCQSFDGAHNCCHEDEVCSVVGGVHGCTYQGNPNWDMGPSYYGAAPHRFSPRFPERH